LNKNASAFFAAIGHTFPWGTQVLLLLKSSKKKGTGEGKHPK